MTPEWKCPKVGHGDESGYLHAADDDSPYPVDGVLYCGRCHAALAAFGETHLLWLGSALVPPLAVQMDRHTGRHIFFRNAPNEDAERDLEATGDDVLGMLNRRGPERGSLLDRALRWIGNSHHQDFCDVRRLQKCSCGKDTLREDIIGYLKSPPVDVTPAKRTRMEGKGTQPHDDWHDRDD